jgi:hypothetical protein
VVFHSIPPIQGRVRRAEQRINEEGLDANPFSRNYPGGIRGVAGAIRGAFVPLPPGLSECLAGTSRLGRSSSFVPFTGNGHFRPPPDAGEGNRLANAIVNDYIWTLFEAALESMAIVETR